MTFQTVNFGAASDGSQGDAVRTGFTKMNANFALALEAAVAASTYIAKASDGGVQLSGKVNGVNNPNVLSNGSGEFGSIGWGLPAPFVATVDTVLGPYIANASALSNVSTSPTSPAMPFGPGVAVCAAIDVANSVGAGSVVLSLYALDSKGALISNFAAVNVPATQLFRFPLSGTTPAGTASVGVAINLTNVTAGVNGVIFRRCKIEGGTTPSLYSQEASITYLGAADAANVKVTGSQSVGGDKTFSGNVTFNGATSYGVAPSFKSLAIARAAYTNASAGKVLIYGFHSGGTFSNSGPVSFAAQVDQQTNWGNSNTFAPPVTAAYRVQASVMVSSAPAAGTSIELALVRGSDSVVMGRERFICTGAQFFNVRMDITLTLALGQGYFIQLAASASVTTSADTSYSRFAIEQVN